MPLVAVAAVAACGRLSFDGTSGGSGDADVDTPVVDSDGSAGVCGDRECAPVPSSGRVSVDMATLTADAVGTCGGGGVLDALYTIDVPSAQASLLVAADLDGTTADSLVHIRRDVGDVGTEVVCDADSGFQDFAAYRLLTPGAGRYYVFLDGNTAGGVIDASIQVLQGAGDACDLASGRDVCGAGLTCAGGVCAAAACTIDRMVSLPAIGASVSVAVDTAGKPKLHAGSCGTGNDGGIRAGEQIIEVQLAVAARLYVTTDDAGTTYDTLVYVRAACGGTEIGCDDDSGKVINTTQNTSVLETPVLAPGTYLVFINGFAFREGIAQVTLEAR